MSNFGQFVKKESLHILRDVRTILMVIGIPIVMVLLFGFAISTDINNIDIAVCAPHRTASIEQVVAKIENNGFFTFKGYLDPNMIDKTLRTGQAGAVIVFNEDYDLIMSGKFPGEKAIQVVLDGSNPNVSASASAYFTGLFSEGQESPVETHILYNPELKSAYNFVPGILGLIFVLVCAMMTSVSIVREKEMGTMEVLLVSPVKPIWIIVAKMIPYFVLSCVTLAAILLLAKFALSVPVAGSIIGIIVMSVLYIVMALAFGLLVSTIAKKQFIALLISGMLMMVPVMLFSGMLFPLENLPALLRPIPYIVPARWYIEAMRKMMIEGLLLRDVMMEFSVLSVMSVAIITVALKKFNDRLE